MRCTYGHNSKMYGLKKCAGVSGAFVVSLKRNNFDSFSG